MTATAVTLPLVTLCLDSPRMKLIKLAAAVLNQTPLDWRGNQSNILAAIAEARAQRASVLCLPELCITGYGCEDAFQAPGVQQMALRILQDCLPATQGMIVSFGLPLLHQNGRDDAGVHGLGTLASAIPTGPVHRMDGPVRPVRVR